MSDTCVWCVPPGLRSVGWSGVTCGGWAAEESLGVCDSCCVAFFFFFQAEDGIRDVAVTGVQTCALPIFLGASILSSEGGELVQILGTLMLANQPYTLLKGAVYIHPTLAEGFFSLMEDVDRKERRVGKECRSRWSPYH